MRNSYYKKVYSKSEINRNVAMASFDCLNGKIWKKYHFLNGKKRLVCVIS